MSEEQGSRPEADGAPSAGAAADERRQRRRNAKRRGWMRWLWALPLLALAAFFIWQARRPAGVEVVRPQKRLVVQTLTASGRVEGARNVELSADRTGILVDLLVAEGDRVEAGDVVARISADVESAELLQAGAAVATARASLSEARASAATLAPTIRQAEAEVAGGIEQARERLAAAEARLDELLAGGRAEEVREAAAAVEQARTRLDQAELDVQRARSLATSDATARAALERSEAAVRNATAREQEVSTRLEQAQRDLDRARRLYDEGVMAEADYEAARTTAETAGKSVEQAQAALRQAEVEAERQRKLLEVTREQELDRAQTDRESAGSQLQAAQARLELVSGPARAEQITQQRAEVRSAHAALDQALKAGPARVESIRRTPAGERVRVAERRLEEAVAARDTVLTRLERTAVGARFAGIVTEVVREPGDVVTPGQAIVMVSEMERPEIHVEIDERDIASVAVGQTALLTADAYPELALDAVVERIAPEAITERGVVDVVLRPIDPPEWLRAGMTVDAGIVIEGKQEMLVLPIGMIVLSGREPSVLVVDDGEVRRLKVETGVGGVRGTAIRSGLNEEALVVRDPTSVRVGERVRPIETSPTAEGEPDV